MKRIKRILRRWLGVEKDRRDLDLLSRKVSDNNLYAASRYAEYSHRLDKVEGTIGRTLRAGFDHHIRQTSWMVTAWRDKNGRERVHFYEVDRDCIEDINGMLKSFKRDNVIIDSHPEIVKHFKW